MVRKRFLLIREFQRHVIILLFKRVTFKFAPLHMKSSDAGLCYYKCSSGNVALVRPTAIFAHILRHYVIRHISGNVDILKLSFAYFQLRIPHDREIRLGEHGLTLRNACRLDGMTFLLRSSGSTSSSAMIGSTLPRERLLPPARLPMP